MIPKLLSRGNTLVFSHQTVTGMPGIGPGVGNMIANMTKPCQELRKRNQRKETANKQDAELLA